MKFFFYIIVLSFSSYSFASIKNVSPQKEEIKKISDLIIEKRNKILKLDASISSLEKDLGRKNNNYLLNVSKIKELENEIWTTQKNLQNAKKESKSLLLKVKEVFNKFVLNQIEGPEEELLERRVLQSVLEEKIENLKYTIKNYHEISKKLSFIQNRLNSYKKNEKELYEIILSLEQRKKEMASEYIESTYDKETMENQLLGLKSRVRKKEQLVEKASEKTVGIKLKLPLAEFKKVKKNKKGISFIPADKNIEAPQDGKVVYSGQLSTYGNLIIIEHKDQIRSVVLGEFLPSKKKGDIVKKSESIGTILDLTKEVYFEIRQKNKTQKISQWLESSSLNRVL